MTLGLALGLPGLASGSPRAASSLSTATDDPSEYEVKAAFLTHFVRYTTWPDDAFEKPDSPIVLLVVGDDPFGSVLDKQMEKVARSSVLVVGDSEGLAENGAHINFFFEGKRPRFEVNTAAVKRSGLSINPEMLKLAKIVKDKNPPEQEEHASE